MPITRDEASALAELLCTIRPQWNVRGVIVKGLGPLAKHPAPLEVIAWAAIRASRDPNNLTPAVIPLNGPHWNLADRPATPRLTPEHECPRHVGKWAGNCPECAAEAAGKPDQGPTEDEAWAPPELDRATLIERTKEAARAARENGPSDTAVALVGVQAPGTAEPLTDLCKSCLRSLTGHVAAKHCTTPDAHPDVAPGGYGTPEHSAAHWARHPNRHGLDPDGQRRAAQADAAAMLTARETGQICDTTGCYWPQEQHNHDPVTPGGSEETP